MLYILDHKQEICKGSPKTGVWYDEKFYEADQEQGRIFIPYGKTQTSNLPLIIIHNNFAEFTTFTRKEEVYSFSTEFYLHGGSVLVGSTSNIVIKSHLEVNGRATKLNMLKNVKVTLSTYNYIDNLPATKTFNDLKFDQDKELVVSF